MVSCKKAFLNSSNFSFHGMPGNIPISNSVFFLSVAALEANDCHLGEKNVNAPTPLSATYDIPETSLQSRESLFQPGTSGRKPEPSLINQHHDSPLETGSGSYSTAETSSQGQYHMQMLSWDEQQRNRGICLSRKYDACMGIFVLALIL